MTKTEMLAALHNVLNNFIFGMVLTRIVPQESWTNLTSSPAVFRGPLGEISYVDLSPLVANMANLRDRKIVMEEFENGLKRALLSEGHELILGYSEETGQFGTYKSEPWFQFARIMRNVVSHKEGGVLRKWPDDLQKIGVTRVSWRARMLDASMVGMSVEFTHQEALQLFKDQLDFAISKLA